MGFNSAFKGLNYELSIQKVLSSIQTAANNRKLKKQVSWEWKWLPKRRVYQMHPIK